MAVRADLIFEILRNNAGRLRVADITPRLAELEGAESLNASIVSATVSQDNRTRENRGDAVRFNTYGDDTEEHGYISIRASPTQAPANVEAVLADYPRELPALLERANQIAKQRLKEAISALSWQDFESLFLQQVLEGLGFLGVKITQRTRDGGTDALCEYQRGLIQSTAIVSAKHWKTKDVAAEEVHRLRGIKGNADTGVIVTSANFSEGAKKEAEPSQNQRSIVLIDGDMLVEVCFANGIGVKTLPIQKLYEFTSLLPESGQV
jgi:restriction endonuclease Mrr